MHNNTRQGSVLLIVLVAVLSLLIGGGAVYYFLSPKTETSTSYNSAGSPTNSSPLPGTPESNFTNSPAATVVGLSGKIKRLAGHLGLTTTDDSRWTYYEAGIFSEGKYSGYKRIVAVGPQDGPIMAYNLLVYIFATKDNISYLLDADPQMAKLPETDYRNPLAVLDKTKIKDIVVLDSAHPNSIALDANMGLFRKDVLTMVDTTTVDKYNGTGIGFLATDFASDVSLKSTIPGLSFYFQKRVARDVTNGWPDDMKAREATSSAYLDGTTQVVVVDSTGLAYAYSLARNSEIQKYPDAFKKYNDELTRFTEKNKNGDTTGPYPTYPGKPSLRFNSTELANNSGLYAKYDITFPAACGFDTDTPVLKNVTDSDFKEYTSLGSLKIYSLANPEHVLNQLEYGAKVSDYMTFLNGSEVAKPTLNTYVSKHPLLFLKDYWGRWVALGEYDYTLAGGCGKPVVYLYPTKPTNVTVSFLKPMKFDVAIPAYQNSWQVAAEPNGTLHSLKQENCNLIDTSKFGSEYAGESCAKNAYPYLYWAGQVFDSSYPVINKGWVVSREDLNAFMTNKLSEIGMTAQESKDMEDYWLPQMLSKNAPYYKISFLQNTEMNDLVPMAVSPRPDSVNRLFLDYTPLISKPAILPEPQTLRSFVRNGFTLVEWGGRKF